MQGRTASFSSFNDAHFDEMTFERELGTRMSYTIAWYWILKLKARFLSGDYAEALAAADTAKTFLSPAAFLIQLLDYFYYTALAAAALYEKAPADDQNDWRERLMTHRDQLREWADSYPPTFADKHALVSAEIARLEGRDVDAMRLYEEAIRSARQHGFVQHEGVALEVAARFYAARGVATVAHDYRRNARDCYRRWGAEGKVRQLEQMYPELRPDPIRAPSTGMSGASVAQLDIGAVVKASHAIASEIMLGQLVRTLMTIALEDAGADRGLLILLRDGQPQIEAEATIEREMVEVRLRQDPVSSSELPESLLHTVIRTRESVILGDAATASAFSADAYIRERRPRSILCLPLIKQATFIGVLYLENHLASHVFTPDRLSVLELLSSQAAISLENARLYADLLEENRDRKRAEEALRDVQAELARTARLAMMGELTASIAHEINQPLAAIASNGAAGLRWLNRATPELDEVRESLAHVVSDATRAADVIRGLRALATKAESRLTALHIDDAIHEVLALTRSEVQRHDVVLRTRLTIGDQPVLGDRVQLQQVVLNLILNGIDAVKAVADRVRELTVSSAIAGPGTALVSVEDSGAGVDPAVAQRMFEPFVTTKPDGLGMGLSICRSIIDAHGGRLGVSPGVPHGTVFHFTVCLAEAT
jgi:signal transduction histidine kinase